MSYGKQLPIILFSLLLVAALGLPAQEGGLGGPVSGLVFDARAGAIRPVLGVPGGAHLGVASASGLSWATAAPSGKLALGFSEGRLLLLRRCIVLCLHSKPTTDLPGRQNRKAGLPVPASAMYPGHS